MVDHFIVIPDAGEGGGGGVRGKHTCRSEGIVPGVALDSEDVRRGAKRCFGEGGGALAKRRADGGIGEGAQRVGIHIDDTYRFRIHDVIVESDIGASDADSGDCAAPESIRCRDGAGESCSQRRSRRRGSKIVHVKNALQAGAADGEYASEYHLGIVAGVHSGKGEGIAAAEGAGQGLQVQAAAGGCRPVELDDQGVVAVYELDAEGFDSEPIRIGHTDLRIVRNQGERVLTGNAARSQRAAGDGVADGFRGGESETVVIVLFAGDDGAS